MDQKLEEYLFKHKISYKNYEHPAVFTVEESKKKVKGVPGTHTKNLFLEDENNNFYLVCMDAEKKLNIKSLRAHFCVKSLQFASPENLMQEMRLSPGSVSIFGMIYATKTKLILDKCLWETAEVGFHPNVNTETLVLSHHNLEKFYNSLSCYKEIIDIG